MSAKTKAKLQDDLNQVLRYVAANYNIELYQVKAERIQGEPNCMVKLPCKYEGKSLALLVGAIPDTGQ